MIDDAISGTSAKGRNAFEQMIATAENGRDKQHFTADGKVLRTLRWMPDGSKQEFGPDGKFLRVIEPGVNIKKAKSDIIKYVPSTPDRVAVIKRMFELCVQGYGCHTIAAQFNAEGIPSPGGQNWNTSRIAKLLRNPVYKGAIAWNRHTMGSLFGLDGNGVLKPKKQKGWKRNSQDDWIISEDVHEPLVSPETWKACVRLDCRWNLWAIQDGPRMTRIWRMFAVLEKGRGRLRDFQLTTTRLRLNQGATDEDRLRTDAHGFERGGRLVVSRIRPFILLHPSSSVVPLFPLSRRVSVAHSSRVPVDRPQSANIRQICVVRGPSGQRSGLDSCHRQFPCNPVGDAVSMKIAEHFLLFRVDADHGFAVVEVLLLQLRDPLELSVAVRVLAHRSLFLRFAAAVSVFVQQPRDHILSRRRPPFLQSA
ncbi:MAG: recombinase family protein [Planctomycetaceae bacterium]